MDQKKKVFHWKFEWSQYLILVIFLRILYAGLGLLVSSQGGSLPLNEPIYAVVKPFLETDAFSRLFVNPWFQWDTISYLGIAIMGYTPDASIAFMPLYPWLIRITSLLAWGNYLLAALILSTVFTLITLILMHELFTDYYSHEVAQWVVFVFVSFPTAFFLLAGYTESLFLALVLAFWIAARKRHWGWAALFAALATLARIQGVVLSVIALWMGVITLVDLPAATAIGQVRQVLRLFKDLRSRFLVTMDKSIWLAVVVPVLVSVAFRAWLQLAGFGTIPEALRRYWKLETVMPWEGFILFLQRLSTARWSYMDYIDLVLFIVILLSGLIALFQLDPAFSSYIWLTLAVFLMRGTPPHLLASYSRYFLTLFPLFALPALSLNRYTRLLVVVLFFMFHVLLAWIFLLGSWVA
jgi:hypothetical protein